MWKLCFLLALATGARRSELHALSRDNGHVTFTPTGVVLGVRNDFLAKNQIVGSRPWSFPMSALVLNEDSPLADSLLCPVRILRKYLEFTSDVSEGPLLLKCNSLGRPKMQTISAWLKNCIQLAYSSEEATRGVKAHEVRKLAASWAFFSGTSAEDVVRAGKWRSANTFTNHYMAEVRVQPDGVFRWPPFIALSSQCNL